ncbi:MAG: type IV pilus twitching motility protein PilT [bacterium]
MGNPVLDEILKIAMKIEASDVHLKPGKPPVFRLHNKLAPIKDSKVLGFEELTEIIYSIMTPKQREEFETKLDYDMAYSVPGVGRFRVNLFKQRGSIGAVMRAIPMVVKGFKELGLPPIMEKIANEKRGLVLVTGTTGSGKSTTLASIIDYINNNFTCNIITIEDPIEYLFRDNRSIIIQREVGFDTLSFSNALRAALRQDPDIILVGEMRDVETIEIALTAAETGHLVLSTLHTMDATETVNRIVGIFPPHQQQQIRYQLAATLKAVISQRLVPKADGKGRVPAVEIMLATARIKELIEDPTRTKAIRDAIAEGANIYGMQTFDQSLYSLMKNNLITYEEALKNATNPADFALKVSGVDSSSDKTASVQEGSGEVSASKTEPKIERF